MLKIIMLRSTVKVKNYSFIYSEEYAREFLRKKKRKNSGAQMSEKEVVLERVSSSTNPLYVCALNK